MKKSVQFSPIVTVLETYSSVDYGRSDIFSAPTRLYPTIVKKPTIQLSLDIITPSLVKDEDTLSSAEDTNTPLSPTDCHKKKKPSLTINTTVCSDPLFFAKLSTHYNTPNDFLSPA